MTRSSLVWVMSVPLMVAGSELAHVLAYRVAYPNRMERALVLASTGHGYFAHASLVVAIGLALIGCALIGRMSQVQTEQGLAPTPMPAWPFAALPPTTFVLQEHLERLVHGGTFPFGAALEPTFLIGLALQLPFALLMYGLARLLLRVAEKLGRLLRTRPPRCRAVTDSVRWWPRVALSVPRLAPLVAGSSGRGPPVRAGGHSVCWAFRNVH